MIQSTLLKTHFHNRCPNFISQQMLFSIVIKNHAQAPKLFSLNLLHYSTTTSTSPHLIVTYLINSLKFTPQEALTSSPKLHHLKTTKNPQSVINFLKTQNLTDPQIKSIVLSQPNILLRKVDKTLVPKFRVLAEMGFSGLDLVNIIKRDPNLLVRSLDTCIVPTFNYLFKILGSKEKIVKAVKKTHWPFYGKSFKSNVVLLEKYGVGFKDIQKIIIRNPRLVIQNPVRLEEKVLELEKEFGIKPGSAMFSYGLSALCSMNVLSLRKKFELFRKFGWCDLDICVIARSQPICFTHSEERLSKVLDFFMNELGFGSSWLASRGSILMCSLEKRVKPRYQVFKVLTDKGVMVKDTVLCLSNVDFVKQVLERYKEQMPDHLYDSFIMTFKQ